MSSSATPSPASAFSADDVRTRMATHEAPGPGDDPGSVFGAHRIEPRPGLAPTHRPAAVLMPLIERDGELTMLLTRRAARLKTHAGQIAFPGGKIDPEDDGPVEAALRESEEEVGLHRDFVDVLGSLDPYLSRTGYHITAVVGLVRPGFELELNPHEVDSAFEVPFPFLMTETNHTRETRLFDGLERACYSMRYRDHHIWGMTAGLIRLLYSRLHAIEGESIRS